MNDKKQSLYIGVDVGTGSARAGVFDGSGNKLADASRDIQMWRPQADFVQQSSEDIWRAVCDSVQESMKNSGALADDVKGIGFDATCSLVVLAEDDNPVSISPDKDEKQNVIVWMDHRAIGQAERINKTNHDVLKYVGGVISPEMQTPKLLWLKENMKKTWDLAEKFLDLPDYLVYRATGVDTRSLCSTVCKWTYLGHEKSKRKDSIGRWDESYFRAVGLGDLADENFKRIGDIVRPLGDKAGGLNQTSARQLGLNAATPVGISIIDAHAGGIGMLGAKIDGKGLEDKTASKRIALIGGTSSCHMAISKDPAFVPGVWGPYFSAMIPDMWLNEGGQSATGALVDYVIFSHSKARELQRLADAKGKTVYEFLNEKLDELAKGVKFPAKLTKDLHVLPYFHGNRSPRADPTLKGMISGLSLDDSIDNLALVYLATIQAIAHGTKHIIDKLNEQGYKIEQIFACGGGTKNPIFLREHADITGCKIILPQESEAVLLGSAVLGAVSCDDFDTLPNAMSAMSHVSRIIEPKRGEIAAYHQCKHKVFHKMYEDQKQYRCTMVG